MADANGGAGRGRPSAYKEEYAEQARKLCDQYGATDAELAFFFNVSERTINRWKLKHPEFSQSLKTGKDGPDDRVERALFNRAVGYSFKSVKVFMPSGAKSPVYAPFTEHIPPDVTACAIWLNNRRPDRWRQRPDGTGASDDERKQMVLDTIAEAEANV